MSTIDSVATADAGQQNAVWVLYAKFDRKASGKIADKLSDALP